MTKEDLTILEHWRKLTFEAADALWAIDRKKYTGRNLTAINQDIYRLRPEFDAVMEKLRSQASQSQLPS